MEFEPKSPLEVVDDHLSRIFMEKLSSASDKSKEGIQTTIFRVPDNIRTTNVGYFEPKIVSIGPYHYGNYRFRAMGERIKLSYASNFFGHGDKNMDLLHCIFERFKRLESNSRCAYSEQIDMASNEFVEMMMLDCAFMASFLKEQAGFIKLENLWTWAVPSIVKDMLIVENQIPLFLLLDFLQIVQPSDDLLRYRLAELFQEIILRIHRQLSPTSNSIAFPAALIEGREHLLHIFHSMLVSRLQKKIIYINQDTVDFPSFPSAEMLLATRIQFANKHGGSSFLDISFDKSKRIMEIPQLVINEDNISLLRNLIAFEQQCHGVDKYISAYVWFMDCLINTNKDVAVLRQRGIIVSRLHSDGEVAQIFNELRRMDVPVVDIDHLYLAEEILNVKIHCRNKYNRLWAVWNFSWLKQNYFKNRGLTIVVIMSIFFNFLTLVQTVFAILSYAKQ